MSRWMTKFSILAIIIIKCCVLQVSELIILNEASERDGISMPDLVPNAQQISEAIDNLVVTGHKLVSETTDEVGTQLNLLKLS